MMLSSVELMYCNVYGIFGVKNTSYYQYRSLMKKVEAFAKKKDTAAVQELSQIQVNAISLVYCVFVCQGGGEQRNTDFASDLHVLKHADSVYPERIKTLHGLHSCISYNLHCSYSFRTLRTYES